MSAYYSKRELLLRFCWTAVDVALFRISPRPFYGWRNLLLRTFGATIGRKVQIYPSARIMYPWLLHVADNVVISWDVKIYNLGTITIGEHTVISQYAHLCGGDHDFLTEKFTLLRTGLTIGKNVWIASDAFIGPGVIVGDNSVVAARAVVVRDVEPGTLVGGNPAKVIRRIVKPVRN